MNSKKPYEKRTWKALPIGNFIGKLTRKASSKRGFAEQRLLTDWPTIIGVEMAQYCMPEKMVYTQQQGRGALLHLRCDPAYAPEIPYLEPIILEKIAQFFGYHAVERLVIHQQVMPSEPVNTPLPKQPAADPANLPQLENVEDEELKAALQRLATARNSDT